ncbi:hypothetical protein [Streptomyces sp. SAI-127]|uniref:hypothetical protein n=1 Tax=Streptomyces sp. SAI-127 TaxID=2940543 RepID=UPI002473CF4B|nr:hypothetical protein [Streptomyces sp. SAI-127]MDH6484221.1 ornithine cyclodeaminase/alanine dehydrogenase-like protein (mu-crystallin family) [Streptomyces sp. SAI-127]
MSRPWGLICRPCLPPDGDAVLGIIGAGTQAELVLRGLHELRQHRQVLVHDIDSHHATGR